MNDLMQLIADITTIIALVGGATAIVIAVGKFRVDNSKTAAETNKTTAETNGTKAIAEKSYRDLYYCEVKEHNATRDELEKSQDELKERDEALAQCSEENIDLQHTISLLNSQLRSAGIIPFTEIQRQQTKPKGGND